MSVKTTLTLPEDLLRAIDRRSESFGGRSGLVETALRVFLGLDRPERDSVDDDLALIARHADELNAEAEDALEYQVPL